MTCQTIKSDNFFCMYLWHEFFHISEGLAYIMNELFGGVVYAGIDTDKHRYPIGKLIYIFIIIIVPLS